ncbi:MAG TPA: ABC transporter permease, partial [Methylomirabilota bacterium]|nr:ABC transporter permease [Methylomirabilota bacterium]
DMIATLQENFITMAKSKGISNRRILWRHALRPSSLTLLTAAGLNVGTLIGGAVITEYVFALPGVGRLVVDAVFARDYPLVQGVVLLIALGFIVTNLVVDVLYGWIDPRIR